MFGVLIPVGPGDEELDRLTDTLESLIAHEPADRVRLVLVDDAPRPRPLAEHAPLPNVEVIRTPLWEQGTPDPMSAMVAGTCEGMRALAATDVAFALKLDTDALVIAPFADKLQAVFEAEPDVGVAGSYDRTCTGAARDFSFWERELRLNRLPLQVLRIKGRRKPAWKPRTDRRRAAALERRAAASGYRRGEHCQGGSYAVARSMLDHGDLFDFRPWIGGRVGEDVVIGLLCRAAGLRLRGLVGEREPFGLGHIGLPGDPDWLAERGHSIVHSLKDTDTRRESDLRAHFRARRVAAT